MEEKYAEALLEKTIQDYNLIADSFSRRKTWKEMRFLFDNYLKEGDKVLDLGCGSGRFFEIVKDKKVEYFGVDSSEKLINIAEKKWKTDKENLSLNFQVADARNLPFYNDFFDKVYAIALLHNIPSERFRLKALKEAKRVLKSDGLLILTVWNLWKKKNIKNLVVKFVLMKIFGKSDLDFRDIFIPWKGRKDFYFHCFTAAELKKLIKKSGFNKIEKEGEILVGKDSNFYIIAKK